MSYYNWFGLTAQNIVQAFPGAILSDFTTNGVTGSTIIEHEMDLAEADVISRLNRKTVAMLDQVEGLILTTADVSGSQQVTCPIPILAGSVKVYVYCDPKDEDCVQLPTPMCGERPCDPTWGRTEITDATVNGQVITLPSATEATSFSVDFDVDTSALDLPDLAMYVRNKTCCILGSGLYSREESEWKLVSRFCDAPEVDDKFIPTLFKKQKWLVSPMNNSLKTLRLGRG